MPKIMSPTTKRLSVTCETAKLEFLPKNFFEQLIGNLIPDVKKNF